MTQLSWVDLVNSTLSQVRVVAVVWPTVQTGLNCSAGALLRFLSNRFQLRTLKQIVNAFTFRRGKKGIPAHETGATSVAPPPRSLTLSLVRGVRRISCTRGAAPPLSFFWFG